MRSAAKPKSAAGARKPRSIARMAAVQALYQMDLAGTDVTEVIDQFVKLRFGHGGIDQDGENDGTLADADPAFFADILNGVVRRQRDIDPLVDHQLRTGWTLVRVDSILRAILRAGVFELLERADVPARVIINEYINVAHAFFDGEESKVVNGVLDRIAHRLREDEFKTEEG